MNRIISLLAISVFLSSLFVKAQLNCGNTAENVTCGSSAPCCSEFGICGTSSLHCGGGCQSLYSNSVLPDSGSCFVDRASLGKKCVSGHYDFSSNTTWVQNADAYNGDLKTTDFVVSYPENTQFSANGTWLELNGSKVTNRNISAVGTRFSSTAYLMYGTWSAKILSGSPGGMVTSFISMSDEKDEIDFEFVGGVENNLAQTNLFLKGMIDYTKSAMIPLPQKTSSVVHEYTITWTKEKVEWLVDGIIYRTLYSANTTTGYPDTPARIQFAVWDGGFGPAGTREWAGGYIDWTKADAQKGYHALFESVTLTCPGDATPSGPPDRATGYKAPTLKDTAIAVVVPGLPGFIADKSDGSTPASTAGTNGTGLNGNGSITPGIDVNSGALKCDRTFFTVCCLLLSLVSLLMMF